MLSLLDIVINLSHFKDVKFIKSHVAQLRPHTILHYTLPIGIEQSKVVKYQSITQLISRLVANNPSLLLYSMNN